MDNDKFNDVSKAANGMYDFIKEFKDYIDE